MTRPRIVFEGKVVALTRRTTGRHFLFNPDKQRELERIYWYCLAFAAQEHGVLVHAATLMSTHSHEVVTDVGGTLPNFNRRFRRLMALCTKALRGWPEEVFNKDKTGEHELLTPHAMVESIAYLMANPVEAGAVRYAKDWPGAHTMPRDVGRRVVKVKRPAHYFDPNNPQWPDVVELELQMPAALTEAYGDEGARARIAERLVDRERAARQRSVQTGKTFLGARRVLKLAFTKRASSYEVFGSLNPQFSAAGDKAVASAAVKRLRAFKAHYDRALRAWTAGERDVCFPHGTRWMRVFHGAPCGPAP